MSAARRVSASNLLVFAALAAFGLTSAVAHAQQGSAAGGAVQAYQELLTLSQKEKRGLMFFVKGQQIGGAVTRIIGNDAVEVRNQTYGRIVIRLDQVDAVAMN
jgi:endonuclease YncB( thermonuclease family)